MSRMLSNIGLFAERAKADTTWLSHTRLGQYFEPHAAMSLSHDGKHGILILCTAYFVVSGIAITIVLQMHKAMVYFLIIRCDSKNKFSTTFS